MGKSRSGSPSLFWERALTLSAPALSSRGATIFVEGEDWYLLVYTTCKHLQADHRCGIYETRPQICRDYTTAECEFEDDWCYEKYFETPEQIDEYADALFGPQFPEPDRDAQAPVSRYCALPVSVKKL